jgi:hypothetical protein
MISSSCNMSLRRPIMQEGCIRSGDMLMVSIAQRYSGSTDKSQTSEDVSCRSMLLDGEGMTDWEIGR